MRNGVDATRSALRRLTPSQLEFVRDQVNREVEASWQDMIARARASKEAGPTIPEVEAIFDRVFANYWGPK